MSQTITEFVDGVDGVRGGVAEAVARKFSTVAELSGATVEDLTALKGIGPVLAERILASARTAVIADHTPDDEPTPDAATRARASVAQARAASRPAIEVVEDTAEDVADPATGTGTTPDAPTSDGDSNLPPVVARVASLVGTTIGWGLRVVRSITQPARHLLHRG